MSVENRCFFQVQNLCGIIYTRWLWLLVAMAADNNSDYCIQQSAVCE